MFYNGEDSEHLIGQFIQPAAIAIDSSNNIYIAESGNDRIQNSIVQVIIYRNSEAQGRVMGNLVTLMIFI